MALFSRNGFRLDAFAAQSVRRRDSMNQKRAGPTIRCLAGPFWSHIAPGLARVCWIRSLSVDSASFPCTTPLEADQQ
jgi:hypothetical protein